MQQVFVAVFVLRKKEIAPDRFKSPWYPVLPLVFILLSLWILGYLLADGIIRTKGLERTVVVKGLSEREYPADVVIWPIAFTVAGNDLAAVYRQLDEHGARFVGELHRVRLSGRRQFPPGRGPTREAFRHHRQRSRRAAAVHPPAGRSAA